MVHIGNNINDFKNLPLYNLGHDPGHLAPSQHRSRIVLDHDRLGHDVVHGSVVLEEEHQEAHREEERNQSVLGHRSAQGALEARIRRRIEQSLDRDLIVGDRWRDIQQDHGFYVNDSYSHQHFTGRRSTNLTISVDGPKRFVDANRTFRYNFQKDELRGERQQFGVVFFDRIADGIDINVQAETTPVKNDDPYVKLRYPYLQINIEEVDEGHCQHDFEQENNHDIYRLRHESLPERCYYILVASVSIDNYDYER